MSITAPTTGMWEIASLRRVTMPGVVVFRDLALLVRAVLLFFVAFRLVGDVAFFIVERAVRAAELAAFFAFLVALRAALEAAVMASSAFFLALATVFRTLAEVRAVLGDRFEVRLRVVFATMGTPLR